MRRAFNGIHAGLVAASGFACVVFIVLMFASYWLQVRRHHITFTSDFHAGVEKGVLQFYGTDPWQHRFAKTDPMLAGEGFYFPGGEY